jgi:hypothetical protein
MSAGALLAIGIILNAHDGGPVPEWKFSLNSVVAILSMVASMGALYVASHGISQLKWIHFADSNPHNLTDITIFDAGSRGVMGAMELLWWVKGMRLVAFGAAALILRIAFGSFIQNLIHIYPSLVIDPTQKAQLARTTEYNSAGPVFGFGSGFLTADPELKASVYTALYHATDRNVSRPLYLCPSGDCNWPEFETLAFCPQCVDVSDKLNKTCATNNDRDHHPCFVEFPGGKLNMTFDTLDVNNSISNEFFKVRALDLQENTASLEINRTTKPLGVYQSLKAVVDQDEYRVLGTVKIQNDTKILGTECTLIPCVHRISASVEGGQYTEKILETFTESEPSDPKTRDLYVLGDWTKRWKYGLSARGFLGLDEPTRIKISDSYARTWLDAMLVGSVQDTKIETILGSQGTQVRNDSFGLLFSSDTVQAMFYANFTKDNCDTPDDKFTCVFNALGRGMTKAVRDVSMSANRGTASGDGDAASEDIAAGEVLITKSFIRIEWAWFSLPIIVWVFSCITMVGSMWRTRKAKVPRWQDNPLPLLYLCREIDAKRLGDDFGDESVAYDRRAEGLKVRLVSRNGRLRLVED